VSSAEKDRAPATPAQKNSRGKGTGSKSTADKSAARQLNSGFVFRAARIIKEAVSQSIHDRRVRAPRRMAHSGDTSFQIDLLAEQALASFLEAENIPLALFTEDRGLVHYGQGEPWGLLVVDPIDGTRPALAGLESACVSVALAEYGPQPRLGDVRIGCLVELKSPTTFMAERGKGVIISHHSRIKRPRLSSTDQLEHMFWCFEMVGRPPVETMEILEPLVIASGLEAGMFLLSSSTYSISRILLGQLDAYVDIGARILTDLRGTRDTFLQAGHGRVVCLFPYDIAAAVLLAQEAGCTVTDAAGRSLDDLPLIREPGDEYPSCLVASNERLHRRLLEVIDREFARLQKKLEGKGARKEERRVEKAEQKTAGSDQDAPESRHR
jgi:myo-inositol-1(or 4)-monophosphatase